MSQQAIGHVPVPWRALNRRFLPPFLVSAVVFSSIVAVIYGQDLEHQRLMLQQEAEYVLDVQEELISFECRAVESDLLYLATQPALERVIAGEASARAMLENEYRNFALHKRVYDQVRCLDAAGQEIVRVNYRAGDARIVPPKELQSKATRYYYQQALELDEGEVFVSPFDLNVEHGQIETPLKPVIRFLTPVWDDQKKTRGLLVLNYLGARLLANLSRIADGFRGETMLINSAGEYLQSPDPGRDWGWQLGHSYSFRGDFSAAWEAVRQRATGSFRVGENLFALRRVAPGAQRTSASGTTDDNDARSLILVAYVSADVANAHSRELLFQLLVLYVGVMVVVLVLWFFWARSGVIREYHERRIADSESRLRQLSSLLLAAQETERRTLSRDLHDELGQQVTAISLDLRSLEKKGQGAQEPRLRRAIEQTDQLLKSLHEIASRVRPSVLDDLGLHDALESLLAEYETRTGITVHAALKFAREEVSAMVGQNVYRIVQEALANVASHAQVGAVDVAVETDDELLRIMVSDSGIGFDPDRQPTSTRLGILGMRERVELLNGSFELQSAAGEGTRIVVSIPLNQRVTSEA